MIWLSGQCPFLPHLPLGSEGGSSLPSAPGVRLVLTGKEQSHESSALRAGCKRRFQKEESLEPTIVFFSTTTDLLWARPWARHWGRRGPCHGPVLPSTTRQHTDCNNKTSTTPCPRLHTPPQFSLWFLSRRRSIRPVSGQCPPGTMEADRQRSDLDVGLVPTHAACGCYFSSPAFQTRPRPSSEVSPGDCFKNPLLPYTTGRKALRMSFLSTELT